MDGVARADHDAVLGYPVLLGRQFGQRLSDATAVVGQAAVANVPCSAGEEGPCGGRACLLKLNPLGHTVQNSLQGHLQRDWVHAYDALPTPWAYLFTPARRASTRIGYTLTPLGGSQGPPTPKFANLRSTLHTAALHRHLYWFLP